MLNYEKWRSKLLKAWRAKFAASRLKSVQDAEPSSKESSPEVIVRKYGKYRLCLCIHKDRHSIIFFCRRGRMPVTVQLDTPMTARQMFSLLYQTSPIE